MTVTHVNTLTAVSELVVALIDPTRTQPWCIVSTPYQRDGLQFDAAYIDRELGDLCKIVVI